MLIQSVSLFLECIFLKGGLAETFSLGGIRLVAKALIFPVGSKTRLRNCPRVTNISAFLKRQLDTVFKPSDRCLLIVAFETGGYVNPAFVDLPEFCAGERLLSRVTSRSATFRMQFPLLCSQ
jgi:hypothetical protein